MASRKEQAWTRHEGLLRYERELWSTGVARVAGLDEVGAGPWAGPVMAACVVLDPDKTDSLLGVNDSKKLSPKRRESMAGLIREHAQAFAIGSASVEEIDQINIRQASLLAMSRAFVDVRSRLGELDHLLVDARELDGVEVAQTSLIKGDANSLSIAAASILAKVERDTLMVAAARDYPEHGFAQHKGYGTKAHRQALESHGITPLHRRSFEPIRSMLG
jgi:ribonuclease HII